MRSAHHARLALACRLGGSVAVISLFVCAGAQTDARRCAILYKNLLKQDMRPKAQWRRDVIDEIGLKPMNDVDQSDVRVGGGTVFVIGQVENFDFRGDMNIKGGFFASLELKSPLPTIQVSWQPTRYSGGCDRNTLKVGPK